MTLLADVHDYAAVVGPISYDDEPRVERLLGLASSAVLGAGHGQQIVAGESSGVTVFSHEGVFYLPQRPVTAVTMVEVDGEVVDPSEYRFEPGGNRRHARLIRRSAGADSRWTVPEAVVDYEHGWAAVPGPLVVLVARMAAGAMSAGGGGVALEWRAEDVSEKVDPSTVPAADMSITGTAQQVIDRFLGVAPVSGVSMRADR